MELIQFSWQLVLWQLFLLVSVILLIYAIIDILKSSFKGNDKLVWTLVVLFVPVFGSILYLFIGRNQKIILGF